MKRSLGCIVVLIIVCNCGSFGQGGSREEAPTANPPKATSKTGVAKVAAKPPTNSTRARGPANNRTNRATRKTPPVASAELTVFPVPRSAVISLNGTEVEARESNGSMKMSGLRPGSYLLVLSQTAYKDERRKVDLAPGKSEVISIILNPIPGQLNVSPSISGAEISVHKFGVSSDLGNYKENIKDLEVEPGVYLITVSKKGYKTAKREITVAPAKSAYLEPLLEPEPVEKPRFRPDDTTSMQTSNDGKYIRVVLNGKSGDFVNAVGSLNVSFKPGETQFGAQAVTGMLPGLPCTVDFKVIENIAEYAFIESPGAGNQWGRVVIRIRPRDSKRSVHFGINWRTVQVQSDEPGLNIQPPAVGIASFEPAVIVEKKSPIYPPAARVVHASGTVVVLVQIDEKGSVIGVKATEGPAVFRQACEAAARMWKFRPALRDGQPVRSTQAIQFNFKPE